MQRQVVRGGSKGGGNQRGVKVAGESTKERSRTTVQQSKRSNPDPREGRCSKTGRNRTNKQTHRRGTTKTGNEKERRPATIIQERRTKAANGTASVETETKWGTVWEGRKNKTSNARNPNRAGSAVEHNAGETNNEWYPGNNVRSSSLQIHLGAGGEWW